MLDRPLNTAQRRLSPTFRSGVHDLRVDVSDRLQAAQPIEIAVTVFLPKESANTPSGSNGTMRTTWVFTHGSSFAKFAGAGSARPQERRDNSCPAPAHGLLNTL